jgi:hypothetical protein
MSFIEGRFWWGTYIVDDDPEVLSAVLTKTNRNQRDQNEHTALRVCVEYVAERCLAYVLSLKPDINCKTQHSRDSMFHLAVYHSFPKGVELLCKYDTTCINARDSIGITPLHTAINRYSGYECAMILLKYGANPCLKYPDNSTPLDILNFRCFNEYLKQCRLENALVLAGGWYNRTPRKNIERWLLELKKGAANCRLASRSLERVLKLRGVHKDVIPLMVNMVEETKATSKIWSF